MDEFRLHAYERSDLYKERMKKYHDRRIVQRNFQKGDMVVLFNSRLKLSPGGKLGMKEQRLLVRHCLCKSRKRTRQGLCKSRQRTRQGLCYGLSSLNLQCHSIGAAYAQLGKAKGAAYAIVFAL
ncbi:hypothetical protein CQW23_09107 [Capsicum baccatum]|uniref:Uncharacterized protein n=1 Tax=Capsicum baccatum TaxID=33114 RepID=A0A2G2WVZ6_CAPBA|nr:hypothetical protein CQW23_09107 [Capsicum baccatum]